MMTIEQKRRNVLDKLNSVRRIADSGRLHYLLIVSVDIFTGELQFRTFYAEVYTDIVMLRDKFIIEYKTYRLQYSMYVG